MINSQGFLSSGSFDTDRPASGGCHRVGRVLVRLELTKRLDADFVILEIPRLGEVGHIDDVLMTSLEAFSLLVKSGRSGVKLITPSERMCATYPITQVSSKSVAYSRQNFKLKIFGAKI